MGATLVNYGFDYNNRRLNIYTETPDDDTFHKTARVYVDNHGGMTDASIPCETKPDGSTNGAAWYSIEGSMADYHYLRYGTIHLTIEINCMKYPPFSDLIEIFKSHRKAVNGWVSYLNHEQVFVVGNVNSGEKIQKIVFSQNGKRFFTWSNKYGLFRKALPNNGLWNIEIGVRYELKMVLNHGMNEI